MKTIKKFLYLLSHKEKHQAYVLLLMIFLMAIVDMLGIASIMPFMAIIINPEIIETNNKLKVIIEFTHKFGISDRTEFLFFFGISVFIFLLFSLFLKGLTLFAQVRFISLREYTLGKRLLESYLNQSYTWLLNRNSAAISKTIISETSKVIGKGLYPLLNLITQITITISIVTLLMLVDFKLTLMVSSVIGIAYLFIFLISKKFISKIGRQSVELNESRFKALSEAFKAFKEIKLNNLESVYVKQFINKSKLLAKNTISLSIIGQIPRFALEAITFGGMILVILYLISKKGNFVDMAPVLALYAFAGYRLMPALQQIYHSLVQIKFTTPALDVIYKDLINSKPCLDSKSQKVDYFEFKKDIVLKKIFYNYPNSEKITLKNISFNIKAQNIIGIVGATGSGKTTIVDILLGLLDLQNGTLEVDSKIINESNKKIWQQLIGYVPQQIFLSDASLASNIALGNEKNNIDYQRVEDVSKIAKLHDFVINDLPNKYETIIGENGIRLSGGQKQRIGIARALYKEPKLLVLDEATSALDVLTEESIIQEIYKLRKKITVIIITHRLSTVKNCDKILLIDKGEVKSEGTFKDLIHKSDKFRTIVNGI